LCEILPLGFVSKKIRCRYQEQEIDEIVFKCKDGLIYSSKIVLLQSEFMLIQCQGREKLDDTKSIEFNYEQYPRDIIQYYTDAFHGIKLEIKCRKNLLQFITFLNDEGKSRKEISEFENILLLKSIDSLTSVWHETSFTNKNRFIIIFILYGTIQLYIRRQCIL